MSHVGRAVVAVTSAVAVVCATAVMIGAAVADPAVAVGRHEPTALRDVQDVVAGAAATGVAAALPAHADLAVNAVALAAPEPAPPAKGLRIKQRYGIDVSWPQCGTTLPIIQLDFAVIGLTDGHADSVSPCFADQVAWAQANHLRVAVYVVPNSPGAAATAAMRVSGGRTAATAPCTTVDAGCPAYAAGVLQAQHAMAAAAAAKLPRTGWWLDVEESAAGTLWSDDLVANSALLKGWVDTLRAANLPVGAYSTHGYWTMITGGWAANLPQWVPVGLDGITSAQQACAEPFTTGTVVMTQWLTGPYDGNILCPSTDGDPLARAFTGTKWAQPTAAAVPALLTTPVPHPEIEQAQADAAAESDGCDADAAAAGKNPSKKQHRVADTKKDPKDDDTCATADGDTKTPKSPKTKDNKTPKAKATTKPKTKGQSDPKPKSRPTSGHAKPKVKTKAPRTKAQHHRSQAANRFWPGATAISYAS